MIERLSKSKIWVFFIILILIFIPSKLSSPAETDFRSIVLAVGIDKKDTQYEVSFQILIPHYSAGFNETTSVISGLGDNLYEASQAIYLHVGKIAGFGHASTIVFGESMKQENIVDSLDFFLRSKRVNNNALVVATNHSAKNLLTQIAKIDNSFTLTANNIIKYNESSLFATQITVEQILSDYYRQNKASLIPVIETTSESALGIDSNSLSGGTGSGGQAGSQSSGTSQSSGGDSEESQYTTVSNEGKSAIYKNGLQIASLESDDLVGFSNFYMSDKGIITLTGITDSVYQNATVVVSVLNTMQKTKYSFSPNGIPRVTSQKSFVLKVNQVMQENMTPNLLYGMDTYVTEGVQQKFMEYMKTHTAAFVNIMKQYDVDILNVASSFHKFHNNKWNDYLDSLTDPTTYFQKVEFFFDVSSSGNL